MTIDTSRSLDKNSSSISPKTPSDSNGGSSDRRDLGGRTSAFNYISPVSETNDVSLANSRDQVSPKNNRTFAFGVDSPDSSLELNLSLSSTKKAPMSPERRKQEIRVIDCRDPEEEHDQAYDAETSANARSNDEDLYDRQGPGNTYDQRNELYPEEIEAARPLPNDSETTACQSMSASNQNGTEDENQLHELDLRQCLSESTQHGFDAIDADSGSISGYPEGLTTSAVGSFRDSPRNKATDQQLDDQSYSSWSIKPKVSSPYSVNILIDHEDKPFDEFSPRSQDVDGRKLPDDSRGFSEDDIDDVKEVTTNDLITIMEEATSSIKAHEIRYGRRLDVDHVADESADYANLPTNRPSVLFHDGLRSESNQAKPAHAIVRRSRFTTPTFPDKATKSTDSSSSGDNAAESDFYHVEDFRESFDSLELEEARCTAPPVLYHWLDSTCLWLEGIHCFFCFQSPIFRRPKKKGTRSKITSASGSLSKKVSRPSSPQGSVSKRRRLPPRSRSHDERSRRSRTSTRSLKERRSPRSRGENHVQFAGNLTNHGYADVEME
jgi:hypothetical protein